MDCKYCNSKKITKKYSKYIGSTRPDLEGGYPCILQRGEGAFVYDLDNNKYIDFTCSTGATILGYAYPEVLNTLKETCKQGNLFITPFSEEMGMLAENLIDVFQGSEKVIFFKTGSEATTAAIRLARVYKGKKVVLTSGYHGWHDWQLTIFPKFTEPTVNIFDFHYNINRLKFLLDKHKGNISCVIITPEPAFFSFEYFERLWTLIKKYNVLLIFDEVMSGFRFNLGGVQKNLNLKPDLTVIGKGLANEFPLSAILGRKEIINARDLTHLAGTFNHEMSSIIVALKTLDIVKEKDVIEKNLNTGKYFLNQLQTLFYNYGIRVFLTDNAPAIFHIIFENENFAQAFYLTCLNNGVFLNRFDQQMVSFSHNNNIIDEAISRIEASLILLKDEFPSEFYNQKTNISFAALNYRTLHEFGGLPDYDLPNDQVPLTWEQDDR